MVGLIYLAWPFLTVQAATDLSGRILLQVETNGEAWYVNPLNQQRYYLGRPDDAFAIMRSLGLGISELNYAQFQSSGASKLKGRILLRVQAKGEAYYVNPLDNRLNYLGRPADAFALMRRLGLGISNTNLDLISIATESALAPNNQVLNSGLSHHYTWSYNNQPYYLDVKLSPELFKSYTESPKVYTYFVGSEPADPRAAFYGMFLQLRSDDQETMAVLNKLNLLAQSIGLNGDKAMAFIMAFIQYIPYDHEKLVAGNNNPYYPFETLYLDKGVCADKTFLAVLWLRSLGYGAAILDFPESNHSAAGIACPLADSLAASGYCYIETTNYFPIGVVPPNISDGQAVVNKDQLDSLFKADRLGQMYIKQESNGKLFQGMGAIKLEAASILSLRQELDQAKPELDQQQTTVTASYEALKIQEAELMSYKNSGDIATYNSLVPAYNEAVAAYTAQADTYSAAVLAYNLLAQQFNHSYSSFYQQ
ncbi:transglutaminase-like domain-containing protein [Patescibacteria group bacterium]|nr:transglutaminase-like domain-containing protein [Patescibacteria group bacterium]